MVAFLIRPVTDFNEVTYHMLEAIHCHISSTKSAVDQRPTPLKSQTGSMIGGSSQPAGGDISGQLLAMYDNVVPPESGFSIADMHSHLGGHYPSNTIKQVVEKLMDNGQLYSTIDDEHFAKA